MRRIALTVLAGVVISFGGLCAAAGFESGDVVVVSLPVGDDFYIAGGKVVVTEPVTGDLVAAGGSMVFNGAVGADLQAAGGSLLINAPVADDLRAAGGDVIVSSTVGGDLLVYGGSVTIPAGAVVEGDAVIGAGTVHLGGTVRGDLLVHAGSLDFNGTVLGDARFYATDSIRLNGRVEGDTVFTGLKAEVLPGARFGRDVSYWREDGEMDLSQVAVVGQARFDPDLRGKRGRYTSLSHERPVRRGIARGGFFVGSLLSGIAVIIVSILLLKGVFRRAGEVLYRSYWQSTGIGLLTLILLPVIGFLAFITIIGIPLGLVFMILFFLSLLFGRVIAAMAFAAWFERRRIAEWSTGRLLLASIGFYVAIKLVGAIPFIGWLAALFAVLAGYGALVMALRGERGVY